MAKFNWLDISKKDVIKAIDIFNKENPEYPEPKVTFLIYEGQRLPAKHIRGMAYKVAYGKDIRKSDYGGGMETVRFFKRLGFDMYYTGKSEQRDIKFSEKKQKTDNVNKLKASKEKNTYPNSESKEKITISSKNVTEDKNSLQLLLNKIYKGDIVCEKTFPWLKSPKEIEGIYKGLYKALSGYRGDKSFAKKNITLRCDFVCESEKVIIEYDERQHFSEARRISLLSYRDIKLGYDRDLWIRACQDIQAKDNHPFNRDEARAYYDSVRDIESNKNGYKLVRIMHGQIDFESDKAESELKRLLGIDKSSEIEERKTKSKPKNGLKIGMYLQTDELKNKEDFNKVLKEVKESEFDIFVLPEFSYFPFVNLVEESDIADKDDFNKICQLSLDLSEEMEKAIVISSIDKYGTIFSLYANAFASTEETELGFYIKHTMTSYSAFDFDNYEELAKSMFEPIIYKGYRIGMTICYDCNHSLFSRIYGIQDIDILINSTGGDVVYDKWYKYNKARAIENSSYNFVTMGGDGLVKKPRAYVYGFNPNGKELTPINAKEGSKVNNSPGTIYIYDIRLDDGKSSIEPSINQSKSINKNYHLEFSIGQSFEIIRESKKIAENIYIQEKENLNIVFIIIEGDDILKAEKVLSLLYSKELKQVRDKRYIIVNKYKNIDEEFYKNKLSVVLKVRAMENFCALVLESDNINNCYQSGKNRTAQVLETIDNKYRIDLTRTTGPEAIWKNKNGMRASWRKKFELLIGKIANQD